jgi:hypothetical protein
MLGVHVVADAPGTPHRVADLSRKLVNMGAQN